MTVEGSKLDDAVCRQRVAELLAERGVRKAAQLLGLHSHTVLAIAAGTRVMPGSMALAREALRKFEEARRGDEA